MTTTRSNEIDKIVTELTDRAEAAEGISPERAEALYDMTYAIANMGRTFDFEESEHRLIFTALTSWGKDQDGETKKAILALLAKIGRQKARNKNK